MKENKYKEGDRVIVRFFDNVLDGSNGVIRGFMSSSVWGTTYIIELDDVLEHYPYSCGNVPEGNLIANESDDLGLIINENDWSGVIDGILKIDKNIADCEFTIKLINELIDLLKDDMEDVDIANLLGYMSKDELNEICDKFNKIIKGAI